MTTTGERGFRVRALGEIAIRCGDVRRMEAFYRDVIGLPVLSGGHRDGIVFFALGESYGGHTAVLALFAADGACPESCSPQAGVRSSLHHLALTVDRDEQAAVMAWYDRQGLAYTVQEFDWIGWRGVFTADPEGNTVELVAKVATASP